MHSFNPMYSESGHQEHAIQDQLRQKVFETLALTNKLGMVARACHSS
jgi:hypothetical protein